MFDTNASILFVTWSTWLTHEPRTSENLVLLRVKIRSPRGSRGRAFMYAYVVVIVFKIFFLFSIAGQYDRRVYGGIVILKKLNRLNNPARPERNSVHLGVFRVKRWIVFQRPVFVSVKIVHRG